MSNFNRVSWAYDFLVKLVFGKSLRDAQAHYLKRISNHSKILVIGGGTGIILEDLYNLCPNTHVDYVEASSSMIRLAKKKAKPNWSIEFIHQSDTSKLPNQHYDYIIAGFFLDVFPEKQLETVVKNLKSSLKPEGKLHVTDFHTDMYDWWWSRALLKGMFLFFRLSARLASKKLLPFSDFLNAQGLSEKAQGRHYHSLVWTSVWSINK